MKILPEGITIPGAGVYKGKERSTTFYQADFLSSDVSKNVASYETDNSFCKKDLRVIFSKCS